MATDYDAPRKSEDDNNESIEALKAARNSPQPGNAESEDADNPGFELGGADLSNVELDVVVLPAQEDEFTCMNCFLVKHRSQLAGTDANGPYCTDCAA